jgi:hypothetical protein
MAIPNTTSGWGLQDVVDEINPYTDDLISCVEDSVIEYFDPLYVGSRNSLLNFRNYTTPSIIINYDNLIFNGDGDPCVSGTISVTANTSWDALSSETFISLSPVSGVVSGTITVTCASNPNSFTREAIITVESTEYTGINDTCNVEQLASGGECA